jgi:hypothetical protein
MSRGAITKYLFDLIAKQVEDYSLVVWYDPKQHYAGVAESVQLPKTTVARYKESFIKPRRRIDHLLNEESGPDSLVSDLSGSG